MSERKVNNLATTSAQNYAAMEITSKSDKWMIDFGIECAKNEALRNEIAALTAENARLKAPVSEREGFAHACCWADGLMFDAAGVDAILAARASTPPDANTSWFCVPCGFTTRDTAEAQAHLGPHMIELTCPFDGQIWRFHTQAQADMLQKHLDWHAAQLSTPITTKE